MLPDLLCTPVAGIVTGYLSMFAILPDVNKEDVIKVTSEGYPTKKARNFFTFFLCDGLTSANAVVAAEASENASMSVVSENQSTSNFSL